NEKGLVETNFKGFIGCQGAGRNTAPLNFQEIRPWNPASQCQGVGVLIALYQDQFCWNSRTVLPPYSHAVFIDTHIILIRGFAVQTKRQFRGRSKSDYHTERVFL